MVRFPDDESYLVDCIIGCVTAKAYEFEALRNPLSHPSSFTVVLRSLHINTLHVDVVSVNESDRLNGEVFCFIYENLNITNFVKWIKFGLLPFLGGPNFCLDWKARRFVIKVKLQPTQLLSIVELVAYSLNPYLLLEFVAMLKYGGIRPAGRDYGIRMSYRRNFNGLTRI